MKNRRMNVKRMMAMVLAVLMLADTVDIPALTVQAADYKSAETVVAAEQEAVS